MKEILQMEMTRWILGRRLGLYNLTSRKRKPYNQPAAVRTTTHPSAAPTPSLKGKVNPLKPHFVREYTIQLASLEAINPICPAFLETAPLLPSGHFPPLGAACDVK